jgi:aspartyl-tRNA(Asn)/glutamyl-tRNA(Gln) amidotransferase subunit C
MELNKDLVLKIASTARLNLTNEEVEEFLPQLKDVLSAFDLLNEVDTTNISASLHPINITGSLREDEPKKSEVSLNGILEDKYFVGPNLK